MTAHDGEDPTPIPRPRKALHDIESLAETQADQPVWRYDQRRKRGSDRTYSGYVKHIHGAHAERLRGELAEVVQELLEWATQQQSGDQSTEDGEAA